MQQNTTIQIVSVFASELSGGNPAPIAVNAEGLSDAQMQNIAREYGLESGFILPPTAGSNCDFKLRYFVPNHEMSMCGHVTVGAVWLLRRAGQLPLGHAKIETKSGLVEAQLNDKGIIEISQPVGTVARLPNPEIDKKRILTVLGISDKDLAPFPIQNASTSRVKTLIPLVSPEILDRIKPDFTQVEALCEQIDSTGLYPYAIADAAGQIFDARQFPKSSGYPEDAATGIAASALSFGLLENALVAASGRPVIIRQGRAMQRPSEISVRFILQDGRLAGCWLGGHVRLEADRGTL